MNFLKGFGSTLFRAIAYIGAIVRAIFSAVSNVLWMFVAVLAVRTLTREFEFEIPEILNQFIIQFTNNMNLILIILITTFAYIYLAEIKKIRKEEKQKWEC